MQLEMEKNISPSNYMAASDKQYQMATSSKGIGFKTNDHVFEYNQPKESAGDHRFQNKTTRYLQSFKFKGVKDRFDVMLSDPKVRRRVKLAYFVLPVTFSFIAASKNYVEQSFLVYLKYQAMVDAYHSKASTQVLSTAPSVNSKASS